MKSGILFLLSFLIGIIGFSSCDDDNITPTVDTFKATLNGASETPANASTATGSATFTFNPVTNILSGTVTYTGLTVADAHIHKGAIGVAGNVVLPLGTSPFTSPIQFTSSPLTQAQITDLEAGLYYVNLHSVDFPDGEIRGQLLLQSNY